jgi:hypothetical protein
LSTTGFNYKKQFTQQKQDKTIRLLSWNVDDFVNNQSWLDTINCPRRNILNFIKFVNADVICFQDFRDYRQVLGMHSNIKYLTDTLKYNYSYISVDDPCNGEYYPAKYGTAIFSRFPIEDSGRFAYNWKHLPEHLMFATLNINGKKVRFYNTHLRSMMLHKFGKDSTQDYKFVENDTAIIFHGHRYQKLVYYDSVHILQAKLIKEELVKKAIYIYNIIYKFFYESILSIRNESFIQNWKSIIFTTEKFNINKYEKKDNEKKVFLGINKWNFIYDNKGNIAYWIKTKHLKLKK